MKSQVGKFLAADDLRLVENTGLVSGGNRKGAKTEREEKCILLFLFLNFLDLYFLIFNHS